MSRDSIVADLKEPTLVIDLDGTILHNAYPELGEPILGAKEALSLFKRQGWRIKIHTCRLSNQSPEDLALKVEMIGSHLRKHGIPFDHIVVPSEGKPMGELYIDDRGLRFDGSWEDVCAYVSDIDRRSAAERLGKLRRTCLMASRVAETYAT